jgi:hypothetical protein
MVVWTVISIRRLPTRRGNALARDPGLSEPHLELGTSVIVPCASLGDVPATAEEVQIRIGHAGGVREQHRDLHAPQHRRPPAHSTVAMGGRFEHYRGVRPALGLPLAKLDRVDADRVIDPARRVVSAGSGTRRARASAAHGTRAARELERYRPATPFSPPAGRRTAGGVGSAAQPSPRGTAFQAVETGRSEGPASAPPAVSGSIVWAS